MILADSKLGGIVAILMFLWFMGVFDSDDVANTVDTVSKTVKEFEQEHSDSIESFKQKVEQTAERMEQKQKDFVEKYEQKPVVSNNQEPQTQELITYEEWERRQNKK